MAEGLTTHVEFVGQNGDVLMTCDLKMSNDQTHEYEFGSDHLKGNRGFSVLIQSYLDGEEMKQARVEIQDVETAEAGNELGEVVEGRLEFGLVKV